MVTDILCLTGLSGSGKSTTMETFRNYGVATFYTGDVHPETSGDEKLHFGTENFDEQHGFIECVVETALSEYEEEEIVVIDSLRSPAELAYVQNRPETAHLVAIVCDQEIRWQRLKRRGDELDTIRRRERRDLGDRAGSEFNIGYLLAVADYYIDNSGVHNALDDHVRTIITKVKNNGTRSEIPGARYREH